jgi:uncharacterized protein YyaL (SSP411 family)
MALVANRLAVEHSPYLLQHKDNPVDWYPWGDEAFARARAEHKPIFLSVGYSTCHWCHVMERESFEDPGIADALNRAFVSVKVDREERPDVDRVYMTFVQATTGSGGWPMSVWLTPSLQPFYGGTYFPPSSRWGRPGFLDVLNEIERVWREEPDRVVSSAGAMVARLESFRTESGAARAPGVGVLERAVAEAAAVFDARRGGFGQAPKFPRPSELLFLLREHDRTGDAAPRDMALATLRAMALGGIRDHLGGGFHRYSVDAEWRVPHFEKMLYDQAQLALAYLEAAQVTRNRWYLDVALDTLEYVGRDLSDEGGGFFSAEDADSVPPDAIGDRHPHKAEGAFYVWHAAEIDEVLGAEADLFRLRHGVRPSGNAPADPQAEFTGKNLLYVAQDEERLASETGRSVDEVRGALDRARLALAARRATRPRPHLDDKVITAWNGLTIAAFARAARVLAGSPFADSHRRAGLLARAQRAASFIREHLYNPESRTLLRRYRRGDAGVSAYAEDYACLIFGLLELFQADGDPGCLEWVSALQQRQDELFQDPLHGGWFSTSGDDASVLLRLKDDHDGAEPAASSMGVVNLLTLTHLTGENAAHGEAIERTLGAFAGRAHSGRAMPMMMAALSTYHAGVSQLVVIGPQAEADTTALLRVAHERYLPSTVIVPVVERDRARLERVLPWVIGMRPRHGGAAAYVCRQFACQVPAESPEELRAQLGAIGHAGAGG